MSRREERAERRTAHIAELRKRASEADAKLKRLYDAIENGVADLSDPMLKNRIADLKAIRDQARADAERAEDAIERLGPSINAAGAQKLPPAGSQTDAHRRWRLSPRPSPRTRPTRRSGHERSSHLGIEKRAPAHARCRFKRENGGFWRYQFCTEVARPKRFELLTPGFVVWCSIQLSYGRLACRACLLAASVPSNAHHLDCRRTLLRVIPSWGGRRHRFCV